MALFITVVKISGSVKGGGILLFGEHQLVKDSVPTAVLLPRQKDVWRSGRIAPRTNNFDTTGYWLDRMRTSTRKVSVPERNRSPFFWHMRLNRLVSSSGRFQGTYYLNLRGSVRSLKIKSLRYLETSDTAYRASQCHVPGEGKP